MPIYEYACKDCGHEFEALVRSSTVPECPGCHSQKLDKLLSVFGTTASMPAAVSMPASPCGGCPNSGGPGGCAFA
ncbi:MAG: zinc ribbon domain-containing protein [Rhodoferax sp.]|uniref:FmdB family zinc ribbon protein n=1 Tax=Rhodoferax sp. TaxID=50421 RepID=UPI00261A87D1|nr:zinc ribbon domain-containing protein [Rhodoferax sp.]MDD2881090.1 zinc ribbon domain-containing protein [Rhodoferax sp.]